jgi:putative FmdB family regulatory protein
VPVYDYVCSACHRLTEVVHGIAAEGPHFCPECGAEGTMTKVISAPSVHFKGSGWAKKDRSSSARASAKSKDEGTPTPAQTKGGGVSESSGSASSADSSSSTDSTKASDSSKSPDSSSLSAGATSSSSASD